MAAAVAPIVPAPPPPPPQPRPKTPPAIAGGAPGGMRGSERGRGGYNDDATGLNTPFAHDRRHPDDELVAGGGRGGGEGEGVGHSHSASTETDSLPRTIPGSYHSRFHYGG